MMLTAVVKMQEHSTLLSTPPFFGYAAVVEN
ncbi:hypothetical protein L917_19328 [Phytophthora nicotianae]|uniref:Uncharacterized protein n=1 Tax=Phytophthora nicotianae TaxID=4792 RepID=W2K4U1_PHYNI|nr:hypothetical protein L917_19328 [Phytophthora nicotianae]ETM33406.1 hypothetical protein L914_19360 [Phytophthora nicotianae]